MNHQLEELHKAIDSTINIERTKAKIDVFTIIKDGHEAGHTPHDILQLVLNWIALGAD